MHALLGPHVDWKQVLLTAMVPLFLLAFAIEFVIMRRRQRTQGFEWRDILTNLGLGGSYQIFETIAHLLVTGAAVIWIYQFRLFDIPVNAWTISRSWSSQRVPEARSVWLTAPAASGRRSRRSPI